MDDLSKRLRQGHFPHQPIRNEAADTIDRLTAERDRQYEQNATQIVRIAELEQSLAAMGEQRQMAMDMVDRQRAVIADCDQLIAEVRSALTDTLLPVGRRAENAIEALAEFDHRQADLAAAAEGGEAGSVRHGYYVASRASIPERSAMWRSFRSDGLPITSTWIDEAGPGETSDFAELWSRITNEVSRSEALIFYAEPDDFPLKGALIEVGIAIGQGIPVLACLPGVELHGRTLRPVGSWLCHPLVTQVPHLPPPPQEPGDG